MLPMVCRLRNKPKLIQWQILLSLHIYTLLLINKSFFVRIVTCVVLYFNNKVHSYHEASNNNINKSEKIIYYIKNIIEKFFESIIFKF